MTAKKEPFDELLSDLVKAFDLIPAIEVIVKCDSISALNSLKKVIDNQIKKISEEKK